MRNVGKILPRFKEMFKKSKLCNSAKKEIIRNIWRRLKWCCRPEIKVLNCGCHISLEGLKMVKKFSRQKQKWYTLTYTYICIYVRTDYIRIGWKFKAISRFLFLIFLLRIDFIYTYYVHGYMYMFYVCVYLYAYYVYKGLLSAQRSWQKENRT